MCGIAGIVNQSGDKICEQSMKKMADAVSHRGPDDEGYLVDGNVGLAHRRLSVIDLSPSGKQPMVAGKGRYTLTYNGEVYNYRELRKWLESRGIVFVSNSDTEVVLQSLIHWGLEALNKFNGMFAFAFWDRGSGELLLARDRYGVKPLYYANQDNFFFFGSEQKTITALPYFKKAINKQGLLEYLTFQNILTDNTLLEDIKLLPAGSWMSINTRKFSKAETGVFWDFHFRDSDGKRNKNQHVEQLDCLFQQAVRRQLVGDVETAAYLSGGIDSGSISAIASASISHMKNFTVGFDLSSASGLEMAFDERESAESMSREFGTEHYQMVLKAGDMERCLPKLCWHMEEPRVGQSYPNYYAAQLASRFVKVVLSGPAGRTFWRLPMAVPTRRQFERSTAYPRRLFKNLAQINDARRTESYARTDLDGG